MGDVVAAMRVRQESLGPVGGPFHRPADLLRRPDADRLLGIDEDLRAEAAADIGRDDAQLVLGRDADEGREHEARHMRVLARGVERERVRARIVFADAPRAAPSALGMRRLLTRSILVTCAAGEGGVGLRLVAEMPAIDGVVRARRHGPAAARLAALAVSTSAGSTS